MLIKFYEYFTFYQIFEGYINNLELTGAANIKARKQKKFDVIKVLLNN